MTLHHVTEMFGSFADVDLKDLNNQLFKFNTRWHGDHEDTFVWIEGRFFTDKDSLVFRSTTPKGLLEITSEPDLEFRVHSYLKFLD